MLLKNISKITGKIHLQSGLHIGAGKDTVEIGGLDQPIIKNPLNGAPYIPGSSLKGKMRSLLETAVFSGANSPTAAFVARGEPCGCGKKNCPICALFGAHKAPKDCDPELGSTRLLVRDSHLTDEYSKMFGSGKLPMEVKYENVIHRVKGTAQHPRPLERVPAGVEFTLDIALKIYEGDPADLVNWVWKALKLVQMDALGGCSSRGSGQVIFEDLQMDGKPVDLEAVEIFAGSKKA